MITIPAPAKVNLALRILVREASGFHQLETLFLALDFADVLVVSSTADRKVGGPGTVSLTVDGPPVGPVEENLVYRAAAAFLDRARIQDHVEVRLLKKIPPGAGLGGGSSDAGSTLRAIKALFPGRLGASEVLEVGHRLGSDVPFFLGPSPMAFAWGRGNRILPVKPLPPRPVILALPPLEVGTASAYSLLADSRRAEGWESPPMILPEDLVGSWQAVEAFAHNDFETVIFREYPLLARIRSAMGETGPRISLLCGSGAALFALYDREDQAAEALTSLKPQFPRTRFVLTRTLTRNPEPRLEPGG